MNKPQQHPPFRPLCCPSCGAFLGDIEIFKIKKRFHQGIVQHPWSLADTIEMEAIPEDVIKAQEEKLKASCHCISIYAIPNY